MRTTPTSYGVRYFVALFAASYGLLSGATAQTVFEDLEIISPLPTPNDITNLAYGNGRFLASVERGQVLSSDDGITWQAHDTGYSGTIDDVAYGNGLYIAISAGSGPALVSSDLETWTEVGSNNLPTNGDNIFFHDGLFYLGGAQFNGQGIYTSADGVSFTALDTPGTATIRDIGYGNGLYIAVCDDLEVMTSSDGVTWTLRPTGSTIEGLGQDLLSVRYLNSLFVVGGKSGTILTSPDGITWTERAFSEDSSWFYSSDYESSTYYFTGRSGTLWSTTDWSSWTGVDTTGSSDVFGFVREEGLNVVVGRDGMILTSPDRATWTDRKDAFPSNFSGVVYGADLFVASDFDGNIFRSSDGENWTQSFSSGGDEQWETIVFEDDLFVVMTSRGEWSLSADGIIWSQPSDGFESFFSIRNLLFANSRWYVGGRDGFLRSSSNLTSWTTHDIDTTVDFYDIAYNGSRFVAVGSEGGIYSSENGSDWTERASGVSSTLYGVEYGNGLFVVTGQSSTALTSADGISWSADGQSSPPFSAQNLEFRDGQFIALDTSGRIRLSGDGQTWTTVNTPSTQTVYGTAVSDDVMVAVGLGGIVMAGDIPPPKELVVTVVGEGSVASFPEGGTYPHLADVTLTATGSADFAFSGWSGDASGNENPLVVSMDSDKNITATFVLSVTGFALWRYTEFNAEQRADAEATSAEGDFDFDGLTNFMEYRLGFDPTTPDIGAGVEASVIEIGSDSYLTVSYKRATGQGDTGQSVEVQLNQSAWSSGSGHTEQVSVVDNGDGTETVTVRSLTPMTPEDLQLMRLRLFE